MKAYRDWFDGLAKIVKIILSIFGIFSLLYRLFIVIEEKAKNTDHLIYLILCIVPIIGFVIVIFDIIAAATEKPVPLDFAMMTGKGEAPKGEEAKPEEEAQEK